MMCGINGYMSFISTSMDTVRHKIQAMNDCIIHRGPDSQGVFADDNIGIGMRRLSIIDLNTGDQPIWNEDKSKAIVLNGEIYNYQTLKNDLVKKEHHFNTNTDTEVLLHAFEEYGISCLQKLEGMFAFCILDLTDKSFILGRDRFGEKPLYYLKNEKSFAFASELKSLICLNSVKKEISPVALNQYLSLSYIPAPLTIFKDVYKLPAAHWMRVKISSQTSIAKYWNLAYSSDNLEHDYERCKGKLRDAVYKAVEMRMVSDVPIGSFLSGGIDSTIITSIMAELSPKSINTFTMGFENKRYDETEKARIVSKKLHTIHHEFILKYDDALAEVSHILSNMDEPYGDSSIIATYMIAKEAAKNVKVILTGDTGDELFGGYSKYLIGYYSSLYKKTPAFLRNGIIEPLLKATPDISRLSNKIRKVVDNASKSTFDQRRDLMCVSMSNEEVDKLVTDKYACSGSLDFIKQIYDSFDKVDSELTRALYVDLCVVLEGDMFTKTDRASMLASLETRAPLIDSNVVNIAYKTPGAFKIRGKKTKAILKDTFSDLIPKEIMYAPKHGFGVPVGYWFKNEMRSDLETTLAASSIDQQGILNSMCVNEIVRQHLNGERDRFSALWSLYVFEKWYQKWMY